MANDRMLTADGATLAPAKAHDRFTTLIRQINQLMAELDNEGSPKTRARNTVRRPENSMKLIISAYLELGTLLTQCDSKPNANELVTLPQDLIRKMRNEKIPAFTPLAAIVKTIREGNEAATLRANFPEQLDKIERAIAFQADILGAQDVSTKLHASMQYAAPITEMIVPILEEDKINPHINAINTSIKNGEANALIYALYKFGLALEQVKTHTDIKRQPQDVIESVLTNNGIKLLSELKMALEHPRTATNKEFYQRIQQALAYWISTTDQREIIPKLKETGSRATAEITGNIDLLMREQKAVLELQSEWEKYANNMREDIRKLAEKLPPEILNYYIHNRDQTMKYRGYRVDRIEGTIEIEQLVLTAIEHSNIAYLYGNPIIDPEPYIRLNNNLMDHADACSPETNPQLYASIIKYYEAQKLLSILSDETLSYAERIEKFKYLTTQKGIQEVISFHRDSKEVKFPGFLPHQDDSLEGFGLPASLRKNSLFQSRGAKLLKNSAEIIADLSTRQKP